MDKPTVQDIFHRFYPMYLDRYTPSPMQAKVARCIINCKTGAYGANISICEDCGHPQIHYNSCRNRCCPMCQASNLFADSLCMCYQNALSESDTTVYCVPEPKPDI